jgi:hypothetical protein
MKSSERLRLLSHNIQCGCAGGEQFAQLMGVQQIREFMARYLGTDDVISWYNQSNMSRAAIAGAIWNASTLAASEGQ